MLKNNLCGILDYIFKIYYWTIINCLNEIYRKKNQKFQMFLKSSKIFHLHPRKVHVIHIIIYYCTYTRECECHWEYWLRKIDYDRRFE